MKNISSHYQMYQVEENVRCLKCNNKGAVQSVGIYYPKGLGNKVDEMGRAIAQIYEKFRNMPYIDHTMGFGGTIPYRCLNCGNCGLIDMNGLEGYVKAFKRIKEDE